MRIRVNGVRLNVEQQSGCNPPLVLLHGFTGSTTNWTAFQENLRSQRHVIAIDLLGHGLSDSPPDPQRYSTDRTVEDLHSLFDYLDLEPPDLLGYSLGGRVALHFAISRASRLHSLILESTSPGIADERDRKERLKRDEKLADFIETEGIESFVDLWEQKPLFASQAQLTSKIRVGLRQRRLASNPQGLANSLRGSGAASHLPLFDQLSKLTLPTLFIAGSLDKKYCDLATLMHSLLPGSTLAIIPDAGHTVHLEQPAAFERCLSGFLANQRLVQTQNA